MSTVDRLPQPLCIGRLVRFNLGFSLAVFLLLTAPTETADPDGIFWFLIAYSFLSMGTAINLLFSVDLGRKVQAGTIVLVIILSAIDYVLSGTIWLPILAWFAYGLIILVTTLSAISFLIAALLATPGCEWRAIPHLIGRIKSQDTKFYPCMIYLHKIDHWEARRQQVKNQDFNRED